MKILVLSLLRVGDLIQQRPLLGRLREKHPGAEIHLLVNRSVLPVRALFPEVDLWFAFDREGLQKQLGSAETPLLKPVRELASLVETLSREHYDLLYNFTHNRLSAHLAAAIPAGAKKGLLAQGPVFRTFENPWLRHFNERFGTKEGSPFHYVELLAGAFELGGVEPGAASPKGNLLLIQPLTSDVKKSYPPAAWNRVLDLLREARPDLEVKILGAPFEEEWLRKHFGGKDLAIRDWAGLRDLFQRAALLVTGDTSVKHLAAQAGVPILELALGSADPEKTGAYARGAWVLTSAVSCAPCPHQGPCRQSSHRCAEELRPEAVAETVRALLDGKEPDLPGAPAKLMKTRFLPGLGWFLSSADETALLEKAVWTLFLGGEEFPPVGSLARAWRSAVPGSDPSARLGKIQTELEEQFSLQVRRLQELATLCFAENLSVRRVEEVRRGLADVLPLHPVLRAYFSEIREVLAQPFPSPLHFFGALKKRFEGVGRRIELRRKMIHQLEEANGPVLGKETHRSPEAT